MCVCACVCVWRLVEVYEEDEVVAEDAEAVEGGHLDDEGKEVVDDGVEELVHLRAKDTRND